MRPSPERWMVWWSSGRGVQRESLIKDRAYWPLWDPNRTPFSQVLVNRLLLVWFINNLYIRINLNSV
jgi:hypothetical protein